MSDKTAIEWCEATWSPVTGCTRASAGCDHCYIERTPPFRMAHRRFDGDGVGSSTGVLLHPERLAIPLGWRKPRKVFVCSMADLFHDSVPGEYIAQVWATMAVAEQHTFQVLTKRHARMRSLLSSEEFKSDVAGNVLALTVAEDNELPAQLADVIDWWPLRNVWLGVSAEDQRWADIRIPALLDTPAAVRFVSAEPLLGRINLHTDPIEADAPFWGSRLDWVITGGESGPGARPAHPEWFRSIRDQCVAAGVAYLHKQNGEWVQDVTNYAANPECGIDEPYTVLNIPRDAKDRNRCALHLAGMTALRPDNPFNPFERGHPGWTVMKRVGKKTAGRELDGRTWDQYPAAVSHV